MNEKQEQFNLIDDLDFTSLELHIQNTDHEKINNRIKALKKFMDIEVSEMQQIQLLAGRIEDFNHFIDFKDDLGRNIIFYALWSESVEILEWLFKEHIDLINNYMFINQPADLEPGINAIIAECILATASLESSSLLDWLFHIAFNKVAEDKKFFYQKGFLDLISAHKWISALDQIQAIAPDCIQSHGKNIINNSLKGNLPQVFQWATRHLSIQLMTPHYFGKATIHGMLEAVNWFLANAPNHILNYQSKNGTTIFHLAASSKSNRVFKAIAELNRDSLNQCDNNEGSIVEYALNSYNHHRVIEALTLCKNQTQLRLMRTPRSFVDHWDATCSSSDHETLTTTTKMLLHSNFTILKVHSEHDSFFNELNNFAQLPMERNKIIAQLEQVKPIIILFLCISREQGMLNKVPFEIIKEIISWLLPKKVSPTTITCYKNYFFFNSVQTQEPLNQNDSQEECMLGSDSDSEYYIY